MKECHDNILIMYVKVSFEAQYFFLYLLKNEKKIYCSQITYFSMIKNINKSM